MNFRMLMTAMNVDDSPACVFYSSHTYMVHFSAYARGMTQLRVLEVLGHQQCLCDPSNSQCAAELLSSRHAPWRNADRVPRVLTKFWRRSKFLVFLFRALIRKSPSRRGDTTRVSFPYSDRFVFFCFFFSLQYVSIKASVCGISAFKIELAVELYIRRADLVFLWIP